MSLDKVNTNISPFEKIKKINEYGSEYWSARDLMAVLEYSDYRNFLSIIKKAIVACENSDENKEDHFGQVNEMVDIGSNAKRERDNYYLSRYACYLIVENADSSKKPVALGQTYFAVQTRKQEINEFELENQKRFLLRNEMKTHNTQLADAAKNAGVIESSDYAIFQNYGYMGLYGGLKAKDIHVKKGLKKSQQILDHMGSTELAANLFRATQTEEKLRRENIKGKMNANNTHFEVGEKVRQTIAELGGTMPEELPSVESIKTVERKQQKLRKNYLEQNIEENLILTETKDYVSATSEVIGEANEEKLNKKYIDIEPEVWKDVLKKLKEEGRMLLYTYLLSTKAMMLQDTLIIKFTVEQGFSTTMIKKTEYIEYLINFFTQHLAKEIKKIEVVQE